MKGNSKLKSLPPRLEEEILLLEVKQLNVLMKDLIIGLDHVAFRSSTQEDFHILEKKIQHILLHLKKRYS